MKFETAQDIIRFAIQQEEAARSFYEKAADLSREPIIKKIFAGLAAEELTHKNKLNGLNPALIQGTPQTGNAKRTGMGERHDVPFKPQMTGREILDYAINSEADAERLYLSAAEQTETPELKKLLLVLANAERSHLERLMSLRTHPAFAQ